MLNNTDTSGFKLGDLVIGSSDPSKSVYSSSGAKLIHNGVSIYGDAEALEAQNEELTRAAIRGGGKLLPTENKSKTDKNKRTTTRSRSNLSSKSTTTASKRYSDYEETAEYFSETVEENLHLVQFENAFGKMKAKILHVIEQELALMLIFKDEDSMVFEPKVGETLSLHMPNKRQVNVYYPGVTFDSPDDSRKFMILFKTVPEEQE